LLYEPDTAAAVLLAHVEPDPARSAERIPETGSRLGLGFQRLPEDAGGDAIVDETPDGRTQVLVVLSDPDRHAPIVARA
jgi:hypothetical protein